jgi:hypothetical protein
MLPYPAWPPRPIDEQVLKRVLKWSPQQAVAARYARHWHG